MRTRTLGAALALLCTATFSSLTTAPAGAELPPERPCDFDGNGRNDIAVGSRLEAVDGVKAAGGVQVTYVNAGTWLTDFITMGLVTTPAENSYFGTALACGDFNRDKYADLAVGAIGQYDGAGAVYVVYGAKGGLASNPKAKTQLWHQDNVGSDEREDNDLFGAALAVGDFNGDHYDDLAIGVPNEGVDGPGGPYLGAGMIHALAGTVGGLTATGAASRIGECCWAGGRSYGRALATGDIDGDGRDDLAIGMPGATIDTPDVHIFEAGGVEVLQGSSSLLSEPEWGPEVITMSNLDDEPEAGDRFGSSVAMADFDGDGDDDIAVGAPSDSVGTAVATGSVHVIIVEDDDFDFDASYRITQDSPGVPDWNSKADQFGVSLAAGDFDADGRADLAVGTRESHGAGHIEMGSFFVFAGTAGDLSPVGGTMTYWMGEDHARLGDSLATGDVTGDGRDDLLVGVPGATVDGVDDAGAALLYRGQDAATIVDISPANVVQIDETLSNPWFPDDNEPVAGELFGTAIAG